MMQINYHGPKMLSSILYEHGLLSADNALVVNVSSGMGALSGFGSAARKRLLDPLLTEEELDALVQDYVRGVSLGWPVDPYSASKGALNALSRIRSRGKSRTLPMACVCPGWVRTDMGGDAAPRSVAQGADTVAWLALQGTHHGGRIWRDRHEIEW